MGKKIQDLLDAALKAPENEDAKDAYIERLSNALLNETDLARVINLAVKGVSIDHATCIRDVIESEKIDNKRRADLFRAIRNDEMLKNNKTPAAFRFLCVLLASAFSNKQVCDVLLSFIVSNLVPKDWDEEVRPAEAQRNDFKEFFLLEISAKVVFPDWKTLRIKASVANKLIVWLDSFLSAMPEEEALVLVIKVISRWINIGRPYISDILEKEEWEESRPKRRSDELKEIAEHYRKTDESLDKLHEENRSLKKEIKGLNQQLEERAVTIRDLNISMNKKEKELGAASKKIADYKGKLGESQELTSSLETYRQDSEAALLQDIANALKPEYQDLMESIKDEMDVELGEIYREKLKTVFKILEGKGIKL